MPIETFTKHNRMPFVYSDIPDPPSTIEPIVEVGDLVDDHGSIWVDVLGNAGWGWTAIGVHRIETIMRGYERWTRNNKGT